MTSREYGTMLCVSSCMVLVLTLAAVRAFKPTEDRPTYPRSVKEIVPIAQDLGLYCQSDRADGGLENRLVVSEVPLSLEQVNFLRFGDPRHACWAGVVAVSWPGRAYVDYSSPEHGLFWGDLFIFGDPTLIRRLTGLGTRGDPSQPGG